MVTNLINKEHNDKDQETSEMQFEDCALKTNVLLLWADQRLKQNHKDVFLPASSTKTVSVGWRPWTDIEPQDYPVSKQLITLLRHGSLPRENDGAIEFWSFKVRNHFVQSQHWSDEKWKSTLAKGGGNKKIFQHCTDPSGQKILRFQALHNQKAPIQPNQRPQIQVLEQGAVWVMRNKSRSAMLRMLSSLESRNSFLHLWASLRENESSQHLHQWQLDILSKYVIKKKRPHGVRHDKTESQREQFIVNARRSCIKKNVEEIHDRFQRDLTCRDSQLKIDRTERKWIEMDNLAQEKHSCCPSPEEFEKYKKNLVNLSEHIWQKWTDEIPVRLPRSTNKYAPSPPWIWRKTTCTSSFLSIPKVAFVFFFKHIMVAVEWLLVEVELIHRSQYIRARDMSGIKEQGDLLKSLPHLLRATLLTRFFEFVIVTSFTVDDNLLKPTEGADSTPHTSHFLASACTHFYLTLTAAQVWCVLRISFHPMLMRSWCFLFWLSTTLLSTLCSPSSLPSSFPFSCSSPSSSSMMWVVSLREWGPWHLCRARSSHKVCNLSKIRMALCRKPSGSQANALLKILATWWPLTTWWSCGT